MVLRLVFNGMGLAAAVSVAADDKDRTPPEEQKAETSRNWGVNNDAEEWRSLLAIARA
jgi:hypothetical protein